MKQHPRWSWLSLLAVPVLLAWLLAMPRTAHGPAGGAHAAVDCGSDGCGASPRETPATPQYPAPQVDDNAPPAEPPPTF